MTWLSNSSGKILILLVAVWLGFAPGARAAPPPAGTSISNTAFATFIDGASGLNVRLVSNTVATIVQPLEALLLTSNQTVGASPSNTFAMPHQLTNTGNVSTSYAVSLSAAGGSFTPSGLQIVQDTNGNGVADPGEPVIADGGSITLAAGAAANLLITGAIPPSASPGQSALVKIAVRSQRQNASASNLDTITVVTGPVITVTKSASNNAPAQSGALTYTMTALNSGAAPAGGVAVTVNAAPATLFLMRDAVPANTTFTAAGSTTPGAQTLYHRSGDPPNSYVTVASAGAAIDAVAWALQSLPVNATLLGGLSVTVNANAAGTLSNTAYADFSNPVADVTVASNPVQLPLPAFAATVSFYTNSSYTTPAQIAALGAPLFVQVNAAQCNTDPSVIVTHPITLLSQRTGDAETLLATETAPNSGIFRILPSVPTASAATHTVSSGDGILEVAQDDRVTASLSGCGINAVVATVLIDPSGVVFDSKTNAPIAGATVELIDVTGGGNGGRAGAAATVLSADGVTPGSNTVTTGADGRFSFPFVFASTYRLHVTPPNGYAFPSKLPPALLPASRNITVPASYGGLFTLTTKGGALMFDVPLDTGAAGGLFVQKLASKTVAAVGDFVDYTININNNTGIAMPGVSLNDELPAGFGLIAGSARLNGTTIQALSGGAGPALVFDVGQLLPAAQATLTYRVRIGPQGQAGNGVNTAQAHSGVTTSNLATATVQVNGGVFSTKAYLIGKVFADCNANRLQDEGEPGIPGVRIYLDNGTYAITDVDGKYSLYGLTPRTAVAKLDRATIPDSTRLEILDHLNAGDPGSRFVDLKSGELAKADFALGACSDELSQLISERRRALAGQVVEIARAASLHVNLNQVPTADARTLPASGVIGQQAGDKAAADIPVFAPVLPATMQDPARSLGAKGAAAGPGVRAPSATLAALLPSLNPRLGFIELTDGEVVPTAQVRVRVKGPFGAALRLIVNDAPIDASRIGERSSLESRGVTAWEYVGVDLLPGENTLRVEMLDEFGNRRGASQIHLIAPGELAKLQIEAPERADADAQKPVDIRVRLLDDKGVPVTARTALTLESTLGEWRERDLDPKEPGTQVFIEGGEAHFALAPPPNPGKATIRISSGAMRTETELTFVPYLRPMIASGLLDGVVSLRNLNPNSLVPAQGGDGFEQEIRSASRSFDGGKGAAAGRASLFLKGKILGSDLLTMSYDSDKPADTALFRDIQPDQFYPVYGDSSVKGFDAQSTGKLYVRIDHGTSYALYGDFSTQSDNPARVLTQYSRALNGAKTHLEDGAFTFDGFASYTNSTQVIDELPANGTSGPFQLSARNPLLNSQRVDIITRDRNQPSIVLSDTTLAAFTDYAVEPFSGQVLLKAPVPSFDPNLNPNYIRITYEVNDGGPSYWVGGADAREKLAGDLTLGGTFIRDSNPVDHLNIGGANFLWAPNHDTTLVGEFAQSRADLTGTGGAYRLELKHTDAKVQARLYAVRTDAQFSNPSSTYNAGAAEYGAKVSYAFDAKNRLLLEAIKTTAAAGLLQSPLSIPLSGLSASAAAAARREGESIAFEHSLAGHVKITGGLRHVDSNDEPTQGLAVGAVPNNYTSARVRVDAPIPNEPKANVYTQYEQALDDSARKDTTVGGTYQLSAQTRLYATHQTSNSLTGDYALNPSQQDNLTVIGLDTAYMENAKLFDEYRVGDGVDGRSARAAIGLRNLWNLAPGLGLSTSIQQVHPISGVVTDSATALTGAIAYTASQSWKGTARLEWSKSSSTETWLTNIGAAVKITADLTALARGTYNEQVSTTAGSGSDFLRQVQFGMAYRPVGNDVWNALAWIEHKRTANGTLGAGLGTDEAANILSANLNYQAGRDWLIDGRYALKRAVDYLNGLDTGYTAQLIGGRSIWDLNSRWDLGLQYFIEFGGLGNADRQQAIGAELGYLVMQNVWLSLGYNVVGFTDRDLASEDYTQRALYLRIRFKFDENLFKPKNNADALPANAVMP